LFLRANPVGSHPKLSARRAQAVEELLAERGLEIACRQSQLPPRRGGTERFKRLDDAQPTQVLGERRSELDVRRQLIRHEHVWGVQDFGLVTPQGEPRQTAVRPSENLAARRSAI
jgi:hypothetical protein